MKRDMDMIRDLACTISDADKPLSGKELIGGKSEVDAKKILYHLDLLDQAGLIKAMKVKIHGFTVYHDIDLTWDGHEFADAVSNDTVWRKVRERGQAVGIFALGALKDLALDYAKKELGLG